jgi:hypothetical protein
MTTDVATGYRLRLRADRVPLPGGPRVRRSADGQPTFGCNLSRINWQTCVAHQSSDHMPDANVRLLVAGPHRAGRRILSCVLARVRKWFDGAGWFVGAAVVLLFFALLAMLAGLQSRDSLLWTGQQVTGTEQQGLVYYQWHGQSYSLAVPGSGSSKAISVYFNPGDPSQAIVDNVADRVLVP